MPVSKDEGRANAREKKEGRKKNRELWERKQIK